MNNLQLKQTGKKNHTHESPNVNVNTISRQPSPNHRKLQYKRPCTQVRTPHTHSQPRPLQRIHRKRRLTISLQTRKRSLFCLENAIKTALTEGIDFSNTVMAGTHHMVKSCRALHRTICLGIRAFNNSFSI